jgi:hypothetical protein
MTTSPGNLNRYKREKNRSTGHPKKMSQFFFVSYAKRAFQNAQELVIWSRMLKVMKVFSTFFGAKHLFLKN